MRPALHLLHTCSNSMQLEVIAEIITEVFGSSDSIHGSYLVVLNLILLKLDCRLPIGSVACYHML